MQTVSTTRVLIVEDNDNLRWALTRFVSRLGYATTAVGSVKEAIPQISKCQRTLLDLNLPDGTGVDVLNYIRTKKIKTIVAVISGTDDQQLLDFAIEYEPDAVFRKPANTIALEEWLK